MKNLYKIGILVTIIVASCTPETEELKVLRVEQPTAPTGVINAPVDLSNTVVTFLPSQVQTEVFRDPDTKLLGAITPFEFSAVPTKRELKAGENASLQIIPTTSQYERVLPESSYTIEVGETTLLGTEKFKVTLKPDAFKTLDITKEYSILLQVKVKSVTPENTPIITTENSDIYRIKLKFTENKYPEGDNVKVETTTPSVTLLNRSSYNFESNYASGHLSKIKDGVVRSTDSWWVDTHSTGSSAVYLNVTFTKEVTLKGIKLTSGTSIKRSTLRELVVTAFPKGFDEISYVQGTYTTSSSTNIVYLTFKEPIKTTALKLSNFKALTGQYVDFFEVEFY